MSRFLKIPTEMRLEVYELLRNDAGSNHTNLLLTYRQIKNEAHAILMKGTTLMIPYDMSANSVSGTPPKARWDELPRQTRDNVIGIHFKIENIYALSITSITQLMHPLCESGNFSGRHKAFDPDTVAPMWTAPPADIVGDLKITFEIMDYDPEGKEECYASHYDWMIEFFFLVQFTAMKVEETGPKDIGEVREEVFRMLSDMNPVPKGFRRV
ncbi:unnamed protein product [Zymoseptoria tritici ST99CH_3D7]|uniref:Uncharacterized protein n=2 Tax=Zymoseptoria tritici TaxID=1047171 RepID=A0A1X7RTY8_ZYMT9|nr:unnamed protein product [Zymoseptoria tritici ST99CH_3D7]SMR52804.1 unnamed protein product [Zymoseptoria tritici ST99CH_1E4]